MSKKSFFKGLGKKVSLVPEEKPLRSLEEIRKEYDQTAHTAGQLQYLMFAKKLELEDANKKLLVLNQEFHARNELDRQAAAKAASTPVVAQPTEATNE